MSMLRFGQRQDKFFNRADQSIGTVERAVALRLWTAAHDDRSIVEDFVKRFGSQTEVVNESATRDVS